MNKANGILTHPNKLVAVKSGKLFVEKFHISVELQIWTKLKMVRREGGWFYQRREKSACPDWWRFGGREAPHRISRWDTCCCPVKPNHLVFSFDQLWMFHLITCMIQGAAQALRALTKSACLSSLGGWVVGGGEAFSQVFNTSFGDSDRLCDGNHTRELFTLWAQPTARALPDWGFSNLTMAPKSM